MSTIDKDRTPLFIKNRDYICKTILDYRKAFAIQMQSLRPVTHHRNYRAIGRHTNEHVPWYRILKQSSNLEVGGLLGKSGKTFLSYGSAWNFLSRNRAQSLSGFLFLLYFYLDTSYLNSSYASLLSSYFITNSFSMWSKKRSKTTWLSID